MDRLFGIPVFTSTVVDRSIPQIIAKMADFNPLARASHSDESPHAIPLHDLSERSGSDRERSPHRNPATSRAPIADSPSFDIPSLENRDPAHPVVHRHRRHDHHGQSRAIPITNGEHEADENQTSIALAI